MNLYKLSQTVNNDYDTYDSCVVVAKTEQDAKLMHPADGSIFPAGRWSNSGLIPYYRTHVFYFDWALPENVNVTLIGTTNSTEAEVIIASFNAG